MDSKELMFKILYLALGCVPLQELGWIFIFVELILGLVGSYPNAGAYNILSHLICLVHWFELMAFRLTDLETWLAS